MIYLIKDLYLEYTGGKKKKKKLYNSTIKIAQRKRRKIFLH